MTSRSGLSSSRAPASGSKARAPTRSARLVRGSSPPTKFPTGKTCDLWLEVNGHRYQNGSTNRMVFGVPHLVSYLSRFMSLQPGDIISTGTPPGVGHGMKPPVYLRPGDTSGSAWKDWVSNASASSPTTPPASVGSEPAAYPRRPIFQNPLGLIQKLSCQTPRARDALESLYRPF